MQHISIITKSVLIDIALSMPNPARALLDLFECKVIDLGEYADLVRDKL